MVKYVLRQALSEGVSSGEYELVGLNGVSFPVSYVVQSHPTPEGEVYFSLIGRDISEEKAREKQLFEVKQLYETLAEAAQEFVCLVDRDWKILFTNKASADFFKLSPGDMVSINCKSYVEKYAPQTFKDMQKIYHTKQTRYIEEMVTIECSTILDWVMVCTRKK